MHNKKFSTKEKEENVKKTSWSKIYYIVYIQNNDYKTFVLLIKASITSYIMKTKDSVKYL